MTFHNHDSSQPMSYSHLHGTTHSSRVSKHTNYTVFRHRGQYAATATINELTGNQPSNSNLSRFWKECRERDIRKQPNLYNQLRHYQKADFFNIVCQLKQDAKQLNDVMNKSKISRKSSPTHQSRAHTHRSRRASDIRVPPSQQQRKLPATAHVTAGRGKGKTQKKLPPEPDGEQSENCQIFFETRKYHAALHDSLKPDKQTLKKVLEQKWQELKTDVDKTVNYFNANKNKNTNTYKQSDAYHDNVRNIKQVREEICNCNCSQPLHKIPKTTRSAAPTPKPDSETHVSESASIDTQSVYQDSEMKSESISSQHNDTNCDASSNLQYEQWTVRELKEKLFSMNISTETCIEKNDLIQRLTSTSNTKPPAISRPSSRSKSTSQPNLVIDVDDNKAKRPSILFDSVLCDSNESEVQIRHRVDEWVHRWSYRRSFRQLLNSILGYTSNHPQYIARQDHDYTSLMKQYKKALLLIHPDKHINRTFEIQYKAGEMFKVLKESCDRYKKKCSAAVR